MNSSNTPLNLSIGNGMKLSISAAPKGICGSERKFVQYTLSRVNVMHDVANRAWLDGETNPAGLQEEALRSRQEFQDILENGNARLTEHYASLVWDELTCEFGETASNEVTSEHFYIEGIVSGGLSDSILKQTCRLLYESLVSGILAGYAPRVRSDRSETFSAEYASWKSSLHRLLQRRKPGSVRLKTQPF